jgi:hypothetical protein
MECAPNLLGGEAICTPWAAAGEAPGSSEQLVPLRCRLARHRVREAERLTRRDWSHGVEDQRRALELVRLRKTPLFFNFPDICPEPVLA